MRTRRSSTTASGLCRRDFLRMVGVTGAGTALAQVVTARPGGAVSTTRRDTRTVWRLANLGRPACNACKAHNANRYYRTAAAADNDRPHLGCNCAVVSHPVPVSAWNLYFKHAGADRTVYDTRWGQAGR